MPDTHAATDVQRTARELLARIGAAARLFKRIDPRKEFRPPAELADLMTDAAEMAAALGLREPIRMEPVLRYPNGWDDLSVYTLESPWGRGGRNVLTHRAVYSRNGGAVREALAAPMSTDDVDAWAKEWPERLAAITAQAADAPKDNSTKRPGRPPKEESKALRDAILVAVKDDRRLIDDPAELAARLRAAGISTTERTVKRVLDEYRRPK